MKLRPFRGCLVRVCNVPNLTPQADLARVRLKPACRVFDQCRLAGTIGTNGPLDLAGQRRDQPPRKASIAPNDFRQTGDLDDCVPVAKRMRHRVTHKAPGNQRIDRGVVRSEGQVRRPLASDDDSRGRLSEVLPPVAASG